MAIGADVANLIVSLRLDDKGFSGKLNAAAAQLKSMDAGLAQMGRGAGQVAGGFARLGAVAGAAAVGGLGAVVTTAASFEQAFTGVEKTVEGTDAQLAELEGTLRQMARTMPVSFEELAGIGEAGGALGIARESLDEFVDVVARLAVSTDLTAETAATALGQLTNVLQLGESDMESFADSLVALGNAGASTESQIVEMAARFGAAGNAAGLTYQEILALSSAVASMGVDVEAGGSSLSRLFNQVTTNIGTGSKKAEEFANALGLTGEQFKEAWDTDALGTFQDLLNHLNELDQFQAADLLKKIGITGVRDINAIGLMAQNVGFVGDQLEIAQNAQGELGLESGKFFATTQAQWQILKNNVRDAAATLGTDLLPVVNEAMGALVNWLNEAGTQQGLKNFAKDLAEGVRGLVSELKGTDFSGLVGGLQLAATVAKGAFDAFRSLPAPIQQLAIAALVANKVSGGAIGMIAQGLGNLVLGGLKTITAANVTVIGGNVSAPGVGGPVGRGPGGFVGGLAGGLAVGAGVAAAGVAAVEVVNFQNMRTEATGKLEGILDSMPRKTGAEIDASIAKIEGQIALDRPFLEGILFNTNVKPILEAELAELQKTKAANERAEAAVRDAIPWAQRNVAEIQAFNQSEGTRFANLGAKQDSVATAVRNQNGVLAQIRDKRTNVTVDNHITIPVNVNTQVVQNQIYRLRMNTGSGGFI